MSSSALSVSCRLKSRTLSAYGVDCHRRLTPHSCVPVLYLYCSVALSLSFCFLILSPLERFDPHLLFHHFLKASINRFHHTRDTSLAPDMPYAISAITHHLTHRHWAGFFRYSEPPSHVLSPLSAMGCLRFLLFRALPFRFTSVCELFGR